MAASKRRPEAFAEAPALFDALAAFLARHVETPLVLAYSGGMDSTVLLDALQQLAPDHSLRLIHIHHGLQTEADAWADFARQQARCYGLAIEVVPVSVENRGEGVEAAARAARYAALARHMRSGELLLTAHHQRDQAETVLLNLARGAGPRGLRGMQPVRYFSTVKKVGDPSLLRVARPLLDVPYAQLHAYARANALSWVEDPSNQSEDFLRNRIRHHWLPCMKAAVPHMEARLAASARWQAESETLLQELAQLDMERLGGGRWRLPLEGMETLSPQRQKNLLRFWLLQHLVKPPSENTIQTLMRSVMPARADASPVVKWSHGSVRRFQRTLYWVERPAVWEAWTPPAQRPFRLQGCCERIATKKLLPMKSAKLAIKPWKKRFQARSVPPWLRPWWPVVEVEPGRWRPIGLDDATACEVEFIAECGGMG